MRAGRVETWPGMRSRTRELQEERSNTRRSTTYSESSETSIEVWTVASFCTLRVWAERAVPIPLNIHTVPNHVALRHQCHVILGQHPNKQRRVSTPGVRRSAAAVRVLGVCLPQLH